MSVTPEQVRHIANLARIAMSEEEVERLVPELNNILGWVEQLGEVDTEGVDPLTAVIDQKLRLRSDEVTEGNCRDEILANAPAAGRGLTRLDVHFQDLRPPRLSVRRRHHAKDRWID